MNKHSFGSNNDPGDTVFNGIIAGVTAPFICFFILLGLDWLIGFFLKIPGGVFSIKFMATVSVVANILPLQVFSRQERGIALKGLVGTTFLLIFALVWYFRDQIFIE